jgi:hypothetical protein
MIQAIVSNYRAYIAKLLLPAAAIITFHTGIYHHANSSPVACLKLFYMAANSGNLTYYFVAGHHGENAGKPLIAGKVNVRMANAAIFNGYQHIMRAKVPAFKIPGGQGAFRRLRCISFRGYHNLYCF